jgi:hypothetical protein
MKACQAALETRTASGADSDDDANRSVSMPSKKPAEVGDDDQLIDGGTAADAAVVDSKAGAGVNKSSTTSNANGDNAPQIKDTLKTLKMRQTRQAKSSAAASKNVATAPVNAATQVLPCLYLPTEDNEAVDSQSAPVSEVPGSIDTQREGEEDGLMDGGAGGAEVGESEKYLNRFGGWSKDEHELFSKVETP